MNSRTCLKLEFAEWKWKKMGVGLIIPTSTLAMKGDSDTTGKAIQIVTTKLSAAAIDARQPLKADT